MEKADDRTTAEAVSSIFIAHSTKDRRFVIALCRCLKAALKLDDIDIMAQSAPSHNHFRTASELVDDQIADKINKAKIFILFYTKSAMGSKYVKREIDIWNQKNTGRAYYVVPRKSDESDTQVVVIDNELRIHALLKEIWSELNPIKSMPDGAHVAVMQLKEDIHDIRRVNLYIKLLVVICAVLGLGLAAVVKQFSSDGQETRRNEPQELDPRPPPPVPRSAALEPVAPATSSVAPTAERRVPRAPRPSVGAVTDAGAPDADSRFLSVKCLTQTDFFARCAKESRVVGREQLKNIDTASGCPLQTFWTNIPDHVQYFDEKEPMGRTMGRASDFNASGVCSDWKDNQ